MKMHILGLYEMTGMADSIFCMFYSRTVSMLMHMIDL